MQDVIGRNASRLELAMRLLDAAVVLLAGQLAGRVAFHAPLDQAAPVHVLLLTACTGLSYLLFPQFGLYRSWRGRSMAAMPGHLALAWGAVLLLGVLFAFAAHHIGGLSRLWLLAWLAIGFVLLVAARLAVHGLLRMLRRQGYNTKRVLLIGDGPVGREMHRRAAEADWAGYEITLEHAGDEACLDALPASVAAHAIDEIWITLPLAQAAVLARLQVLLRDTLADVRWIPDTLSSQLMSSRLVDFLGFPAVEMNQPRAAGAGALAKDLFDRLFALAALIGLAPVFAAIAIAIKRDSPGPVFYRQRRLGLNGRPFDVYKFRSMRAAPEGSGFVQATRDDPRITPLGHFLRRTSLDELPQFFNVLKGEMSVVGPRPHAMQHNEQFRPLLEDYMLRHRVKPGITGWAQIHGYRGETDTIDKMAMRVQFDLHYIRHWSLWMDLRIIAWTVVRGWTGKNAY